MLLIRRWLLQPVRGQSVVRVVPDVTSRHVSFQERKKMVKEAQREKRRTKVPKHVKKRKEKVAKTKKGR